MSKARLRSPLLLLFAATLAVGLAGQTPEPASPTPDQASAQSSVEPRTVQIGMSEAQVTAALGRPQSVVETGSKKTYSYRAMKVIFADGRVFEIRDANGAAADDDLLSERISIPVLPLEIGFGAAAIALISFLLGRRERRVASAPAARIPAHQPARQAQPVTASRMSAPTRDPESRSDFMDRLRDLEMLRYLGVLTSEEFEEEKEKLGSAS